MYRNILEQMQECVWQRRVVIPTHAFVAMTQDVFTPEDIYHCILQGEIVERQWNRNYSEYKYVLDGEAEDGSGMQLVAKLHQITRDTYIITVYRVYCYDYQNQNAQNETTS